MAGGRIEATPGPLPVLLVIDSDSSVLESAEQQLQERYSGRFQPLTAASGSAALRLLQELQERSTPVALLLVQQQLRDMQGRDLLARSARVAPRARHVLYGSNDQSADLSPSATHDVRTGDSLLVRPWDDPQSSLYPLLDSLIEDWSATVNSPFEGVRIIGDRWSDKTHEVKDFLARNRVPYRWLDIELSHEARHELEQAGLEHQRLPVLLFPNGEHLVDPSDAEIAQQIGFQTEAEQRFYDLIIVGGGPAGLAAAVYGSSEGLRTLIVEREAPGGQAGLSADIENYLGFPEGLSGADLAQRAVEQAQRFGVEILAARQVTGLGVNGDYRSVTLDDGSLIACHAVLIATGVSYRRLEAPGAERLAGKGVYYGAASAEALDCQDQDVCLLGGGNSAGQAALHIAGFAASVTIVTLEDSLSATMSEYLTRRIEEQEHVRVYTSATIAEVQGERRVASVSIKHLTTDEIETIPTTALFVWIGGTPHTDWLEGTVERDERGFILAGPAILDNDQVRRRWPLKRDPYLLETSIPGVFVAGDARAGSVKRIASAVGDGSTAVQFIHQYLSEK